MLEPHLFIWTLNIINPKIHECKQFSTQKNSLLLLRRKKVLTLILSNFVFGLSKRSISIGKKEKEKYDLHHFKH